MRILQLVLIAASILLAQTPPPRGTTKSKPSTAPKPSTAVAPQPFGLKGDVLGETIDEFRARNARVIALGTMGEDRAKLEDVDRTKNLPQCSIGESDTNDDLSWDVRFLTTEEKRAGVVKCIAALSLDDDFDFEDSPTVANAPTYKTVYYFFHQRLYMIKSTLPGKQYPALRSAFVEKYGTPSVTIAEYQNSFGAKFNGEKLLWSNGVSQISMGERDGERDDPSISQMKDSAAHIRSIKINTVAIGKGYEAGKTAYVYDHVLQEIRQKNKLALDSANVLIVIWHNALRKECETAGTVDRKKDM